MDKTKELIVNFRKSLFINRYTVKRASSTKFLGCPHLRRFHLVKISSSLAKKAAQCLYFFWKLKKVRLSLSTLSTFYRGTIESVLSSCMAVWFGSCTAPDGNTLQQMVRATEKAISVSLQDINHKQCNERACSSVEDQTHRLRRLSALLSSGRRYRSICLGFTRVCNSWK